MKAVVAAFNQEKALVGAFSVITNLRMELFEALLDTGHLTHDPLGTVLEGADVAHPVAGAGRGEDLLRGGEVSVPGGVARPAPGRRGLVVQRAHLQHQHGHRLVLQTKAIRRFVITEKAPTWAFSWLKAATTHFTFKILLRHYAKRALTTQSLNVKLGPRRNYHKGRAALRHYANQPARPL